MAKKHHKRAEFQQARPKATVELPGSGVSFSTMLQSGPPTALPRDGSTFGFVTAAWLALAFIAFAVILVALLSG